MTWGIILASINVIIGMLLSKGITRDPTAERLFCEGPSSDGESDFRKGYLWAIPMPEHIPNVLIWLAKDIEMRLLAKLWSTSIMVQSSTYFQSQAKPGSKRVSPRNCKRVAA